jgi:signal transduction histidine kinase/ligand-binding sensor domain-containing protein
VIDPQATFVQGFVEDPSGPMWVTDTQSLLRTLGGHHELVYAASVRTPVAGWRLLADSRGAIWVAALGAGLMRVRGADRSALSVESFRDPRITGSVQTLFRDRENNIWIGMRGGLLRLNESPVVNDTPLDGLMNEGVRGLTASNDGSVWVATTYAVNRFAAEGRQVFKFEQTQALHTDGTGAVWVVTLQGIHRFSEGRFTTVTTPHGLRLEGIGSFTSDPTGALWFCDRRAGVIRWHGAELRRFEDIPEIAHRPCGAIHSDRQGRVWMGFSTGGIAVYQGGRFDVYGEREGLGEGNVATILEDRAGNIWIGATGGLSRFEDGRFTTLTSASGLPQRTTALLEDGDGFLWASGARGLVRFNPREIHRVAGSPSHQMEYTLYDRSDGLPGALASQSRPSAVRSQDGRLWFASVSGVSIIEPGRLPGVGGPTSSRVEEVRIDGRPVALGSAPLVARHGSTLEIAYSALNLSAASKLRFRYKLDGLDENWSYVDGRRQATFASLPPGTYHFRVTATHDGIWREPEGVFAFTIPPPLYRTTWFYLLCVTGLLSLVWGYWQLRLRAVRDRHALVLAERARVSRDIHDTLLQSLTAVGLELEVVARVVGSSHPTASDTVRDCQRRVTECIRETRQSVWALRSPSLERLGFEHALREVAANAAPSGSPSIDVTLRGKAPEFSHQAQEELLRIVREAITNAVRHGQPRRVAVDLLYEGHVVTLRVTDDGRGFVPDEVPVNGEHCGLRNMRERSEALNGRFRVVSSPGAGTVVEVAIPHGAR